MPLPMKFLMSTPIKVLRVEHITVDNTGDYFDIVAKNHWRIWLMANRDFTLGTFLQLTDSGKVNRITLHENGTETIFEMAEDD